jgi:hypothetical protein
MALPLERKWASGHLSVRTVCSRSALDMLLFFSSLMNSVAGQDSTMHTGLGCLSAMTASRSSTSALISLQKVMAGGCLQSSRLSPNSETHLRDSILEPVP